MPIPPAGAVLVARGTAGTRLQAEAAVGRTVKIRLILKPLDVRIASARGRPIDRVRSPPGEDQHTSVGALRIMEHRAEVLGASIDVHQDGSLYFDVHHTANDTVEHLNKEDLDQAAAAFATVIYGAADAPDDFGRVPEDKRKERW